MSNLKTGFRKKTMVIGITIVLAIVMAVFTFKSERGYVFYLYLFKMDHFSEGDKMYGRFIGRIPKNDISLRLYRLIRPMSEHDIDSLYTDPETRATLKLKINPLLKPYLIKGHDVVQGFPKTFYLGNFIKHEVLRFQFDNNKIGFDNAYAIHPVDKDLTIDSYYLSYPDLPDGYTYANNIYYLPASFVTNKPVPN